MKLEEAIKKEVELKVGEEFSIYDITVSLREKLNNDDIYIDQLDYKYLDAGFFGYNLKHSEVRKVFRDLEDELKVEVVKTGTYVTYKHSSVTNTNKVANNSIVVDSPVSGVSKSIQVARFEDEIINYLKNKGSATTEQIQSRLKQKGITCSDIKNFVEGLDCVEVEPSGFVSKSVCCYTP